MIDTAIEVTGGVAGPVLLMPGLTTTLAASASLLVKYGGGAHFEERSQQRLSA